MSAARTFFFIGALLLVVGLALWFVTERPEETTITEAVPSDWNFFTSSHYGFSLRYPAGYTADTRYRPVGSAGITGLALTVPSHLAEGTTLSTDTRISVESAEGACTAQRFLPTAGPAREITENGVTYQVAHSGKGAAGNRYEESVYVRKNTERCIAVRYFIHTTVRENYPSGTVGAFDTDALLHEFDMIRRSLILVGA